MIIHLNWNFLCNTHSVPSQRAPGCDVFFTDARNNQATLSTTGVTESLREERWREVARPDMLFSL